MTLFGAFRRTCSDARTLVLRLRLAAVPSTSSHASAAIVADHASRTFHVPVREPGLRASLRAMVRRTTREVRAVQDVSFTIEPGEVVGFLGPNGAGKTTTLKLLSGLLHPTTGHLRVLGQVPQERDHDLLRRIALVMGNRQQLHWDIPAQDSFEMLRAIYDVPLDRFRASVAQLSDLLMLDGLLDKPVRQLSLGERMKCELAGSLLHRPEIVFLDEPTLGLDVQAQRRVREFVSDYARTTGATVLLTSHYMADIEALAERVLVIHHGRLQFDGPLRELASRTSDRKLVTLVFDPQSLAARDHHHAAALVDAHGRVVEADGAECVVSVPRTELRERMSALLELPDVIDFTVEDEPIERVMERVFESADPAVGDDDAADPVAAVDASEVEA
ncbi:MAG: ATP-binding cassette domain-containing protein [Thermoleophilia bacterium]|nr:ATP-binding cassette domain-containing protein [Thermoleophilia bacterium]